MLWHGRQKCSILVMWVFLFSGPGDYQHRQGAHVAEGEEEGGPGGGRGLH